MLARRSVRPRDPDCTARPLHNTCISSKRYAGSAAEGFQVRSQDQECRLLAAQGKQESSGDRPEWLANRAAVDQRFPVSLELAELLQP